MGIFCSVLWILCRYSLKLRGDNISSCYGMRNDQWRLNEIGYWTMSELKFLVTLMLTHRKQILFSIDLTHITHSGPNLLERFNVSWTLCTIVWSFASHSSRDVESFEQFLNQNFNECCCSYCVYTNFQIEEWEKSPTAYYIKR